MTTPDRNLGLGRSIRAMRRMAKLTQGHLGGRVNLSGSSIGAIERGDQPLTPETLQALLVAMGYRMEIKFRRANEAAGQAAGELDQEALL